MLEEPIILDETSFLSNQLTHQGFIKYSLFPPATLDFLNKVVSEEMRDDNFTFYYSGQDSNLDRKKYFYNLVLENLNSYINDLLPEYTISRIIIVMKGVGANSSCKLHTDDNSFNESEAFPINIWTPLVDTNEENGGLFIVPRSHHYVSGIRGFGIPQYFQPYQDKLLQLGQSITTKLGESIIYHPGILHFSNENYSQNIRPAIVIGLAPKNKEQLLYWGKKTILGLKIYTVKMKLEEYLFWDEKSIPKDKVTEIRNIKQCGINKNSYLEFLNTFPENKSERDAQ